MQYSAYISTSTAPLIHLFPRRQAFGPKVPNGFASPSLTCRRISHVPAAQTVNRRSFLVVSATTAAAAIGCKPAESPAAKTQGAARTDVPLRVVIAGSPRTSDVIKTAWAAVSEQTLEIKLIDPAVVAAADWEQAVVDAMKKNDLGIVPSGVTAALAQARLIANWREDEKRRPSSGSSTIEDGDDEAMGTSLFPVLLDSVGKFGGQRIGQPLGATLPCLIISNADDASQTTVPRTWQEYESTVEQLTQKGSQSVCAEPLAGGAAAEMFLYRVSNDQPPVWLFDRETLAPVIASEVYVKALESMARCVKLYGSSRLSAGEVWHQASSGKLQMAIGWPATHSNTELIADADRCRFASLPFGESAGSMPSSPAQGLVHSDVPVALISSQCRQSDAARRFALWLSGNEGTGMIRDSINGFTILSSAELNRPGATTKAGTLSDSYDNVLSSELTKVVIRPALRILQYRQYLAALDAAVLDCVNEKMKASEALEAAAKQWSELHKQVDIDKQAKAWRMSQGLSS